MGIWCGIELDDLQLRGDDLLLRPWRSGDAAAVHAAAQDPTMHEFLPLPDPYTLQVARNYVEEIGEEGRGSGTGLGCAIADPTTGELLGACVLRLPHAERAVAEIGYWVAGPARGRGVATRATRLLAEWGLRNDLPRIQILCAVHNLASIKVALAAGFRYEGTHRAAVSPHRGWVAAASFARLPDDDGRPLPPAFAPLPPGGLSDDVLLLRPVQPGDAAALHDEVSDPVSVKWGIFAGTPTRHQTEQMALSAGLQWLVGPHARMVMVERASGQIAGSLMLRRTGPPDIAMVGYGVRPAFRGHRYTTRALRLVIEWAFNGGGIARLELGAKTGNVASQKAALAAGFVSEGIQRGRLRNPDGTFSDEAVFGLVDPGFSPSTG
ncbi:MAG: GNAT family N-acetyltransferase [Actinobacteria bacterium]|nr:GNAT family N-acetyltransferase [Actinomycetota bacterium]